MGIAGANHDDELIDLVDEHDRVIGTVAKGQANRDPTLVHREIAVLIHRGELLLWQRRSDTKDVMAGMWDLSCAGHVRAGETPAAAAHRELNEELGFDTPLHFAGRRLVRHQWETYVAHVFAGGFPDGTRPSMDPEEVAAIEWGGPRDLARWQAHGRPVSRVACALAEAFWRRSGEQLWAQVSAPGDAAGDSTA